MGNVVTVGLDLAKNVFQVYGVGADGSGRVRRKLRRTDVLWFWRTRPQGSPDAACLCEAVRQTRQNRRLRAEAICEAVTRPTMRFVAVKSVDQQAVLMLHKVRELLFGRGPC